MTFEEALEILGIEDYKSRIFNSNSHGELFHLTDYFILAHWWQDAVKQDKSIFRKAFVEAVEFADKNWNRPDSVFQHIPKMLGLEEPTTEPSKLSPH